MPPIAPDLSPADELVEVRAMIARLKQREARLAQLVEIGDARTMLRPGWPIVRQATSLQH